MTNHGSAVGDLIAEVRRGLPGGTLGVSAKGIGAVALACPAVNGLDPARVSSQVEKAVGDALDVSLADVLVAGWATITKLGEYRGPNGVRGEVDLAEHTIEAHYRPTLTVECSIAGAPATPPVPFELDLHLKVELDALVLGVAGGRIREARGGNFSLSVALSWKEHELLEPVHTRPIPLGPHLSLGEGIPIP